MGTPLKHILTLDPFKSVREWEKAVEYGRCTQSPYAENALWFVTLRGIPLDNDRDGERAVTSP